MKLKKQESLNRRHMRVRKKVKGTSERPRMVIRKTLRHLYAQIVDDSPESGSLTLASFTTWSKENAGKHFSNVKGAKEFGQKVGQELKNRGITEIVFDRGGYRYHGCVQALAEAVREANIKF
jgi:large subunit ribosomal protein L18